MNIILTQKYFFIQLKLVIIRQGYDRLQCILLKFYKFSQQALDQSIDGTQIVESESSYPIMQSMNKPISLTTGHRNNKIQLMLALLLQESMQDKLMIKQGLLIFWYTVLQGECIYRLKADQWDRWDLNRSGVQTYYYILTEQQVETCILAVENQNLGCYQ
ncbi:hypothetical protein SS50377_21731 [Spironucleus salmonicida]|uniref:Uncharacterized protein n=1 Tax=Spironucleus salmonicida TaxID=348837 RepID=A0A9P8S0X2_9EUKA|nr:hypothetical protein SS50377_21731 [Spironucleus salmonicida]